MGHFTPDKRIELVCEHTLCSECITRIFEIALRYESSYPPSCCEKPLWMEQVQHVLPPDLRGQCRDRETIYLMPNRIHCQHPGCGAVTQLSTGFGWNATCPICGQGTCKACDKVAHEGSCSSTDLQAANFGKTVSFDIRELWKSCGNCGEILELTQSCNHLRYVHQSPSNNLLGLQPE